MRAQRFVKVYKKCRYTRLDVGGGGGGRGRGGVVLKHLECSGGGVVLCGKQGVKKAPFSNRKAGIHYIHVNM